MKASKFTEAQKAFILKQGEEGTAVAEICRKAGISQATCFNWKKRYGGFRTLSCCRFRGHEDKIVPKELECRYDEREVQPDGYEIGTIH